MRRRAGNTAGRSPPGCGSGSLLFELEPIREDFSIGFGRNQAPAPQDAGIVGKIVAQAERPVAAAWLAIEACQGFVWSIAPARIGGSAILAVILNARRRIVIENDVDIVTTTILFVHQSYGCAVRMLKLDDQITHIGMLDFELHLQLFDRATDWGDENARDAGRIVVGNGQIRFLAKPPSADRFELGDDGAVLVDRVGREGIVDEVAAAGAADRCGEAGIGLR